MTYTTLLSKRDKTGAFLFVNVADYDIFHQFHTLANGFHRPWMLRLTIMVNPPAIDIIAPKIHIELKPLLCNIAPATGVPIKLPIVMTA